MFCKYCAEELDDGVKFCSRCGKPQQAEAAALQADAAQAPAPRADDSASGKPVCGSCGKTLERGWTLCPFCGTTLNAEPAVKVKKASTPEPEKAGLYDGDKYQGPLDLMDAIDWITSEGKYGGNYRIVLGKDEAIPYAVLDCKGKQVNVSLKGSGPERTVRWDGSSNRPLFAVHSGVTFTLNEGVALVGMPESKSSVVVVHNYGTFNMNGGSISGNSKQDGGGCGGGIYLNGGTFTMSGGTISGNSTKIFGGGVYMQEGTFAMSGGTISGNSGKGGYGGGVYMKGGTFIKNKGGVIYGSNAPTGQANTAIIGSAVYCGDRKRNTTARVGTLMDSNKSGSEGGWE
jgi:hypothetical protein